MRNQAISELCRLRAEHINKLLAMGHFGADGSSPYMLSAGKADAYRELSQELCEHKMTTCVSGTEAACRVCGATVSEEDCADGSC